MTFAVPVVDIAPYVTDGTTEARARTAAEMDAACRTVGFVQIVGHGVPAGITDGLAAAMDGLFERPLDVKSRYRTPPEVNRGYSPPKSESLSLSLGVESATRMNDFFEAFNVGAAASWFPGLDLPQPDYAENTWPDVPGFQDAVLAYFREAARVARTLTTVFADALGLPAGFFDRFTGHSIDVLRMNNYALPPGQIDLDGDLTGMGEHTDYGIVTVLWADRVAGLQVLGGDRRLARRHAGPGRAAGQPRRPHRPLDERAVALDVAPGQAARGRRADRAAPVGGVLPRRRPRRADRDHPDVPRAPARRRPTRRSRWAST